jgi:hypothetical protein
MPCAWNSQKAHCAWRSEKHHVTEREHDSLKVNVWCALMKNKVINPSPFEEPTVIGDTFLAMMENIAESCPSRVFQLDGTSPHFYGVHAILDVVFPDRWIGRGRLIPWPPCSPDLFPLEFFLLGICKRHCLL